MKIEERYKLNKDSKVGENLICPSCGSDFKKDNYQQAFCKTKAKTKCKDKYWNTVDPSKKNNTTRLSPANKAWTALNYDRRQADKADLLERELNFDGSWDAHQCTVERCKFCERLNCECDDEEYYR